MIRYNYNSQIVPPAPFVHVTLRSVQAGSELTHQPAQLDIGADRTVIPSKFVDQLELLPLDEISVGGFGGQVLRLPTFLVHLAIQPLAPLTVEVIAHAEEPFVLLGRDVLNHYRLVLDGPQLVLEIG